ncbi:MAG: hypothetical protein HQM12_22125 [SAR324 cluster bacterium]|nr:hypothetical protein [SAR324 cluster bacterium]
MYAIEFESHIKNGMIEIPEEYKTQIPATFRVIVLTQENILAKTESTTTSDTRPFASLSEEEKQQRIQSVRGKYRGLISSSDEFARRKQEEIDLEG